MSLAHTARRTRTALTALAGAAVLTLAACGGSGDAPEEDSAPPPAEQSDGGGAVELPESSDGGSDQGGTSDDGTADEDSEDATGEIDEDGADSGAAAGSIRILFAPDLGDGQTVTADQLVTPFQDAFGGEDASCEGDLTLEIGQSVSCEAPSSPDDSETLSPWTAHAVHAPNPEGVDQGTVPAVLFTTGAELSEEAKSAIDGNDMLTGLGFGSMYGMEPISAEQLGEDTLTVLTSENAYIPVADILPGEGSAWSEVTCENELSMDVFAPVPCTATTEAGDEWQLSVLPGTFVDNDRGLLVAIGSPVDV
jgi:hypothetical protein